MQQSIQNAGKFPDTTCITVYILQSRKCKEQPRRARFCASKLRFWSQLCSGMACRDATSPCEHACTGECNLLEYGAPVQCLHLRIVIPFCFVAWLTRICEKRACRVVLVRVCVRLRILSSNVWHHCAVHAYVLTAHTCIPTCTWYLYMHACLYMHTYKQYAIRI